MDVEFRPVAEHELESFVRCDATAFGIDMRPDNLEYAQHFLELDRTIAAVEDGRVVGSSASLGWELTVPGPNVVRAGAVTWVSVLPTHRRRGLLTGMMGRLLDDVRGRGEPLAMLLASESVIYGRFGYGLATSSASYVIERRHATFAAPPPPGRFRLVEGDDAERIIPAVFDRARRTRVGEVGRSDGWWRGFFRDPEHSRDGMTGWFHVVHESATGEPDAYASYRYREKWEGTPEHTVVVEHAAGVDPEAELAVLRFCLDLDLVTRVELPYRRVDEPLRHALVDSRRFKTTAMGDLLWVRVLDIPAALAARVYSIEGRVVLGVDDAFLPENSGSYELAGGPDGAECRPTDTAPDVVLSATDLGAAYLGGTSLHALATAGRVREERAGALARAAAMFSIDPPPYCDTDF